MLIDGAVPWPLCISQENKTTVPIQCVGRGADGSWGGGVGWYLFLALAHM